MKRYNFAFLMALIITLSLIMPMGVSSGLGHPQPRAASSVTEILSSQATYAQEGFPDTPTGSSQRNIFIGYNTSLSKKRTRAYVQFSLPNLGNATIDRAYLLLGQYSSSSSGDYGVTAYRVTQSWQENVLTWNSQPGKAESVGNATFSNSQGTKSIEITNIVKQWYAGTYTNYGVTVWANNESAAGGIFCSRAGTATQCLNQINPKLRIEYTPLTTTPTVTPTVTPTPGTCKVPFFSQRDPRWVNSPLRTAGVCSASCNTIGKCGCTLTSAAMVFKFYGANTTPPLLSNCMGTKACPFYWGVGATCSKGKAAYVNKYAFSWARLNQEVSTNHRPIILGMHKISAPSKTHWIVVVKGSGNKPGNYTINDPWPLNGANMKLTTYSQSVWKYDYISVYSGKAPCQLVTTDSPDLMPEALSNAPQVVVLSGLAQAGEAVSVQDAIALQASEAVQGNVWLYWRNEHTMYLQVEAASTQGQIADVMVWTDTMKSTAWQPYSRYIAVPVSDFMYVRFRDEKGNISTLVFDTLAPDGETLTK